METITVGMDESQEAAEALRWAVTEADQRGASVHAVLAWTVLRQHHVDRTDRHDPYYSEENAKLALQEYVTAVVGGAAAAGIRLEVMCERAAPALVEASADSSMLVVGSRRYGGIKGLVMGSVSQECLHHSKVPVAIVHGGKRFDRDGELVEILPGKVVVGIDGSDTSRRALAWALDAARARGGYVEVVHGWMLPTSFGFPTLALPDPVIFEQAAESMVSEFLDAADTSGLSRPISRVVIGGKSPAGLLLARADNAEVLVVGSRGVGGFAGMVVGSVAHHLARHASCPLVVLPADDAPV